MSVDQITREKHSWITQDFVTELIQGDDLPVTDSNRVQIYQLKLEPAVGKGENYSSDLVRAMAKYSKGHKKGFKFAFFIIKEDLRKEESDVLDAYNVFHREIVCYREILPKVKQLLQSIGDDSQLNADCLKVSAEAVPRYFVFDDLRHKHYKNVDRKIGLDFQHMKLAMIKLGKWHATTAQLADTEPSSMDAYQKGNITPDIKHFHPFFENAMRSLADEVATWNGYEKYAAKLEKLVPVTIAKGCEMYSRNDSDFNVLTHGDLWMNNIMYHYDANGVADDVIFVDYSVGYFGSPGIDLSYLLCTSGLETTTDIDWDNLIQVYHEELTNCLRKLNYAKKIPSLIDIQVAFLRKGFVGLMFSNFLIALRLIEDSATADLSFLLGTEPQHMEFRKNIVKNSKYRSYFENMLKYFDRKGLLDIE